MDSVVRSLSALAFSGRKKYCLICSKMTASDRRCTCSSVCSAVRRSASFRWPLSSACRRTGRECLRRRHQGRLPMAHSPHHNRFPTDTLIERRVANFKRYLLRSHKHKVIVYRNAAVAAALRSRNLEVATQQISTVLLLAGAGVLQRSHAARPATV